MDAVSSFNKSDLLPLSVGKAMIWLIPQHSYRVLRRYRHPEGMIPFHGHALLPNSASSNLQADGGIPDKNLGLGGGGGRAV